MVKIEANITIYPYIHNSWLCGVLLDIGILSPFPVNESETTNYDMDKDEAEIDSIMQDKELLKEDWFEYRKNKSPKFKWIWQ